MTDPRSHLAWLIWCAEQGYVKAEDRAILSNWLLEDGLSERNAAERDDLLAMADEVLAALREEVDTPDPKVEDPCNLPVGRSRYWQGEYLDIPRLCVREKGHDGRCSPTPPSPSKENRG